MIKKLLFALGIVLIVIQFFSIDKESPQYISENDFIYVTNPPEEVGKLLKQACYDCHSYESKYPWYTNVAPVSWWIKHHINEGRDELNFSAWDGFSKKRKKHKLKEMIEMVDELEMPLTSYTWAHPEAKLTREQRDMLIKWVKNLQ